MAAVCFLLVMASCKPTSSETTSTHQFSKPNGIQVADTIIYSVLIKNNDSLDQWTTHCLSKLDRKKMVDLLFESVYKHDAQAYNYLTEAPMTVAEVKAIEAREDFSRDKVSKLQFWETWHYDASKAAMEKSVLAVLVAYEATNDDGEVLGHKAAFYIKRK